MQTLLDIKHQEASRKHAIMAVASMGQRGLEVSEFDSKLGNESEGLKLYHQGIITFHGGCVYLTPFGRKLAKGR